MQGSPNNVVTAITNAATDRILTVGTVDDEQQDLNGEANLTFDGSTLTVPGNLTVTGTTATVSTTNTVIKDQLLELGNGRTGSASGDAGVVVERGSDTNAGLIWDESANTWVACTTSATGASTGDLTLTDAPLKAASLDISGDIDVDGTANLDAVDIDGAVQLDNTLTVGANDQGYDVKLYGDTASAYLLWDTSVDDLILGGAAGLVVPDGQLVLGSTAVTSTAAELNLLDGVSGLVQADFTKLAAVDATAAEINAACDASARTAAAVDVNADHFLFCDGGATGDTKVEAISDLMSAVAGTGLSESSGALNVDASQTQITAVGTIATGTWQGTAVANDYVASLPTSKIGSGTMADARIAASNVTQHQGSITATGALNGGSITSGFGNIDNGSSSITCGAVTASGVVDVTDTTDASDASGDTGALRCEGGASIAKKLYVGTDLDVDGTANLDAVDIDGAVQLDGTLTVGANDQGYDVILYGDTASANVTWDTSVDDLILNGAARIVVPDSQLVLGSTAVTATAAELNLLDGVSGLAQADLTKLAAVDSTAAELNLLDGNVQVGASITIADGDGFIVHDGGTMKTIPASDLKTYAGGSGTAADDSNLVLHMQAFA